MATMDFTTKPLALVVVCKPRRYVGKKSLPWRGIHRLEGRMASCMTRVTGCQQEDLEDCRTSAP